ncbi:MAG: hypothetical protein K0V04_05390, partial [Deltaproteobacteria bacterium]|nr:hypothetical protein [Deltaproteobacteria bacterium]
MPLGLLASLGACLEPYRDHRLVGEQPVFMGLRADVVEDGPYAVGFGPLPPDRRRAELLPLDVLELDALVASDQGPLDLDETEAQWLLCTNDCPESASQLTPLVRCDDLPDGRLLRACDAGVGSRPQLVMPLLLIPTPYHLEIGLVSGVPGGPTTAACMEALERNPPGDLWGCVLGSRTVPLGPAVPLALYLLDVLEAEGGEVPPNIDPLASLPPLTVSQQLAPNAAPVIETLVITWPDGRELEHPVGEPLAVEFGEEIAVAPLLSPRDEQVSILPSSSAMGWTGERDTITYRTWVDYPGVA